MLVTLTGFGSVWRHRFGKDETDPERFVRAAYFNTTGVVINGKVRSRPKVAGHIRFNGVGGFDPHAPLRMLNSVFECAEPCLWKEQNKVLFKRLLSTPRMPDFFLVVTKSREVGRIAVGTTMWRSQDTLLISFSECGGHQELMLLMRLGSWVKTEIGTFDLRPFISWPWSGRLQLQSLHTEG